MISTNHSLRSSASVKETSCTAKKAKLSGNFGLLKSERVSALAEGSHRGCVAEGLPIRSQSHWTPARKLEFFSLSLL